MSAVAIGLGGFLTGMVVVLIAMPVWFRLRNLRSRRGAELTHNRITTVSQAVHLAIQGAPTGIVIVDKAGAIILTNQRAHELSMVHDRDLHPEIWAQTQHVFADMEMHELTLSISPRGGQRITSVRAVVQPLSLLDGRFAVAYGTDESENVRLEAARHDFVANVSHELKTPVGGMSLLAEALLSSLDDPDQVRVFGEKLHKESLRMGNLVSELISLSKLQGAEALPEMEPVCIDEVINEAFARNQVAAEAAHIPLRQGKALGVMVNGDKNMLVTAVSNLITNAINYSTQELPVTVTQKVPNSSIVQIRVTDRGMGISRENQERVFERFFRVDKARSRSTGGTGLGLAIVKHVVANHGGTIKLWSRLGTGSTFTIELPILRTESSPLTAESSSQKAISVQKSLRGSAVERDARSPLTKAVERVTPRRKEKTS